MFGNLAAFVNGNMFAGLFGEDLFVRLPDDEAAKVRKQGGRDFAPMAGRPMKGYVTVPGTWRTKPEPVKAWIVAALEITGRMPPKVAAAKKPTAKKADQDQVGRPYRFGLPLTFPSIGGGGASAADLGGFGFRRRLWELGRRRRRRGEGIGLGAHRDVPAEGRAILDDQPGDAHVAGQRSGPGDHQSLPRGDRSADAASDVDVAPGQ